MSHSGPTGGDIMCGLTLLEIVEDVVGLYVQVSWDLVCSTVAITLQETFVVRSIIIGFMVPVLSERL